MTHLGDFAQIANLDHCLKCPQNGSMRTAKLFILSWVNLRDTFYANS
jgi:hypothetical protein